jgi:hypothetical protein
MGTEGPALGVLGGSLCGNAVVDFQPGVGRLSLRLGWAGLAFTTLAVDLGVAAWRDWVVEVLIVRRWICVVLALRMRRVVL